LVGPLKKKLKRRDGKKEGKKNKASKQNKEGWQKVRSPYTPG